MRIAKRLIVKICLSIGSIALTLAIYQQTSVAASNGIRHSGHVGKGSKVGSDAAGGQETTNIPYFTLLLGIQLPVI